jgi:hypothetical protein
MMKSRTSTQILDEIAQQQTRIDVSLSSSILAKVRKEKTRTMKTKFVFSGVLTFVVILSVMFSIPSVATAMKRLLGFIPGAGLVENDSTLRVLTQTSQIKQDGTTISVIKGVADSQKTILVYQVENLPAFPTSAELKFTDICQREPELHLPDGSVLQGKVDTGNSWVSGYSRRIVFGALPAEVNNVALVFTCLEQSVVSPGWSKLEIQLQFEQAAADEQTFTLVDLPTPIPDAAQSSSGEVSIQSDIRLVVNQYAKAYEDVVLFGVLESISGNNKIEMIDENAIHLVDSSGKEIPLVEDPTIANPLNTLPNEASHQWAYLTAGTYTGGKATLTVDSAWIRFSENAQFTIDIGEHPQAGQKFDLNHTVRVADRDIVIQSVEINTWGDGISFTLTKPDDVSFVTLMDLEHPLTGGGGGPDNYGFTYIEGVPTGKINVTLTSLSIDVQGPWSTSLELPASTSSSAPAEMPPACLTKSTWAQALANPAALPAGLTGKLAYSNPLAPEYYYHVMSVNLDGSNYQDLGLGDGISLSPDNQQAVFNSDTGMQLMNMDTKVVTPLASTRKNDRGAIWSPDGTKIAFTRGPSSGLIGAPGPYSIYISNPDGSQQTPVVENVEANTVMAWLPDGKALVYTVAGPNGAKVKSINLTTGVVTDHFETNYVHSNIAVSPDGKKAAFEEMLPGDLYGIFTENLDGSNKKLIVNGAPIVVTRPFWSPDGKWLIVSVHDENLELMPTMALVEIDNCQIIPLKTISGYVGTWNP